MSYSYLHLFLSSFYQTHGYCVVSVGSWNSCLVLKVRDREQDVGHVGTILNFGVHWCARKFTNLDGGIRSLLVSILYLVGRFAKKIYWHIP